MVNHSVSSSTHVTYTHVQTKHSYVESRVGVTSVGGGVQPQWFVRSRVGDVWIRNVRQERTETQKKLTETQNRVGRATR